MKFAGYMNREVLMDFIKKQKHTNTNTELIKLYECLYDKLKSVSDINTYYGYIIYNKLGKSLEKLEKNDINEFNIKNVLTSFSDGIRNFINNLYQNEYLHGDIKIHNMTIKDDKIYFIDFGYTDKYNTNRNYDNDNKYPIVLGRSLNLNYPLILHVFSKLFFNDIKMSDNKAKYVELLNDIIDKSILDLTALLKSGKDLYLFVDAFKYEDINLKIVKLVSSHEYSIFKTKKDVVTYLKTNITNLLNNLEDNKKYTPLEVYNICFIDIAKNVDIYSLSLALYHLFVNNIYQKDFTLQNVVLKDTLKLISELFNDALYNKIENPIDLANRLDEIIKTIK